MAEFGMFLIGLIVVILMVFFFAWLVQITWNYTLPDLFGVKHIAFFQALALLVLFGILLGPKWYPMAWPKMGSQPALL